MTKVRYNDKGTPAVIEQEDDIMKVYFGSGVNAIAPGQAAVFYENNDDPLVNHNINNKYVYA